MTDAAREAMWKASEQLYRARREAELRQRWYAYHIDQADRLERLVARLVDEHRRKAESLHPSVAKGPSVVESVKLEASSVREEEDAGEAGL
jgi:nitrogen-specific signal transduction histidine kinase